MLEGSAFAPQSGELYRLPQRANLAWKNQAIANDGQQPPGLM